nr:hypothetical protein [Pseudomonas sp. BIGb0427]
MQEHKLMNTSRKAVLVCGLILMASPLAGWAETEKYICEYSKMEDNQKKDFGYDSYKASSVQDAEKQSRADPSTRKNNLKTSSLNARCTKKSKCRTHAVPTPAFNEGVVGAALLEAVSSVKRTL